MDHARSGRVARPVWFDAGMERALVAQGEIEQGIRYGLEHGQFVPYFEPQVDLATGEIVGFEVLARWNHPLSGIIGPDVFIPVAEEIGLIGRLSEQVIGEALARSRVLGSGDQDLGQHLADPAHRRLARAAHRPDPRRDRLSRPNGWWSRSPRARCSPISSSRGRIVTSLKNQGIRLALDDFGTGFSSLSHLRSLPFDIIKIDRSFVSNINVKRESLAIIRAVTTLASALSVPVCVEGIENEAAFDTVVRLGCAIGQGWYFGKPMPAEQARELLAARRRAGEPPVSTAVNG